MTRPLSAGMEIPPLHKGPVTQIDLVKYSGASGDFNPIHTVESFAIAAGLGGVIAHGMLTMAYVGQMLTDFAGMDADLVDFRVRFRAMVRPGDTIVCRGVVTEIREDDSGLLATLQVSAETQRQETVVKGTAMLRYPEKSP